MHCIGCRVKLFEPFIRCSDCQHLICLFCFSKGYENDIHANDHSYEIIRYNFHLFDEEWTVNKELKLLNSVKLFGYGNWDEIACMVLNNYDLSDSQIKRIKYHYNNFYLEDPHDLLKGLILSKPNDMLIKRDYPVILSSLNYYSNRDMAGYSAHRSDFINEYNDSAELDICDISPDDFEQNDLLINDLYLNVIEIYRNVLKDRNVKKRKVAEYGLINLKNETAFNLKFEKVLGVPMFNTLKICTRFLSPIEWKIHLQSFYLKQKLQKQVKRLQTYRNNGLKWLKSINIFENSLKLKRETNSNLNMLSSIMKYLQEDYKYRPWCKTKNVLESLTDSSKMNKKPLTPLDISSTPCAEYLTDAEKQLCSNIRIVPPLYLKFKQILIKENTKNGFVKLAQARTLIKIDVNKTRKVYDFLINENLIKKDLKNKKDQINL